MDALFLITAFVLCVLVFFEVQGQWLVACSFPVLEWIQDTLDIYRETDRPDLVCNDTFIVNIQTRSKYLAVCTPEDIVTHVDVYFPDPILLSRSDKKLLSQGLYVTAQRWGFVPVENVEKIIDNHYGIDHKATVKRIGRLYKPENSGG